MNGNTVRMLIQLFFKDNFCLARISCDHNQLLHTEFILAFYLLAEKEMLGGESSSYQGKKWKK